MKITTIKKLKGFRKIKAIPIRNRLKLFAFDIDKLTKEAQLVNMTDSASATKAGDVELEEILSKITKDRKCKESEAFASIAILSQIGGTATSANGEKVKVVIGETEFKLSLIRKIVKEITGNSLRRIAKTFPTQFKEIAEKFGYQGNQLNTIRSKYPNFKLEKESDKFWVSDFQSENTECPDYIRDSLNKYYNEFVSTKKKKS